MTTCPLTEEEWLKAEKSLKCSPGIYHCLRTRENFLIEVCAPRNTMIQSGGCPYWNIHGNVDREDCSMYPECPDEPFLSNAVYKYPFCYEQWSELTTKVNDSSMYYTSTVGMNESDIPEIKWFSVLFYFLSCAVLVVLIILMAHCYCILEKQRRQREREHNDTEQQPLRGEHNGEPTPQEPTSCTLLLPEHNDTEQQSLRGEHTGEPSPQEPSSYTPLLPEHNDTEQQSLRGEHNGEPTPRDSISCTLQPTSSCKPHLPVVKVDQDTYFVKHNAFVKGTKLLKSNHALMIIGYPGSGKSITGRQIVRHFEKKGWKSSSFDTLENATVDMTTGRQVVFIDNCFGKRDLKPSVYVVHQMKEKLTPILNDGFKKSGGFKCILSMEKNAYETYKELLKDIHNLNHSIIIDMDSDKSYTHSQKEQVMETILGNTEQQNKQRIKKCLEENSEARLIGYPLKVWFLKHIPDLEVRSNDWIGALRKIFDDMRISQEDVEKQKNYAALMYVMLKGQFSAEDEFDEQCMEQLHSSPLCKEDLLGLLRPLKGFMKTRDENTWVFAHEILYVAAFIEFHKNDPHTFFQYCNMKAILEIVKLSCDDTVGNPLVINLERDHYHFLVDRIIEGGYQEKFFGRQLGEAATFGLVLNRKQGNKETEKKLKAAKENNAENRVTELDTELKARNQEYDELLHEITKTAESVSNQS